MRSLRVQIWVAVLIAAVSLRAVIAVLRVALDSAALRIVAVVLAGSATFSGVGLALAERRLMLRVDQLRGWVKLVAGESETLRREIASDPDAVYRVQLAIIDMLGMRMDQQGAIYRRLEEVLNAIPDGVVVVTSEGLISLVNAAGRPLFESNGSVIGTSIYETLSRYSLAEALTRARVLIGCHIDFDVAILRSELQRCGRDWRATASLDVMLLYAGLFPDRPSLLLDDIAADLKVPVIGRHSALGDALTTGEIFVRLLAALSEQGLNTLEAAQALQDRAARRLGVGAGVARPVSMP